MKLFLNRCAEFAMGFALIATAPCVAGMSPIFLDGFESGDLCAWQGSCPAPADVEGTWIGVLVFPGGVAGPSRFSCISGPTASLLGYLLGTSESWVVRSGPTPAACSSSSSPWAALQATGSSPCPARSSGGRATLALTGDLANQTVELVRWSEELVETSLLVADSTDGLSTPHFVSLAVALDAERASGGGQLVRNAADTTVGTGWRSDLLRDRRRRGDDRARSRRRLLGRLRARRHLRFFLRSLLRQLRPDRLCRLAARDVARRVRRRNDVGRCHRSSVRPRQGRRSTRIGRPIYLAPPVVR